MSETNTSYSYELNADGSARITSYQGDAVFLTVPAELDGHKVIDIGRFAFYGLPNLKYVKLPEGVVTIFVNAFYGCPELETVEIPSTIDNSVNNSVRACYKFRGYKLPDNHPMFELKDGVLFDHIMSMLSDYPAAFTAKRYDVPAGTEIIGIGAFAENTVLEGVYLASSVKKISDGAFRECGVLREVTLPDGLEVIGNQAFAACPELESISIPASVVEIGQNAFSSCWKLCDIEVREGSQHYCELGGALCTKDGKRLLRMPVDGRTSFAVPNGVESIAAGAFSGCTDLREVILPITLKSIEGSAFAHCSALESIVLPEGIEDIAPATFFGCTGLENVVLPGSLKKIDKQAFHYCFSLKEMTVPAGCEIDEDAFGGDKDTLEEIGVDCKPVITRK